MLKWMNSALKNTVPRFPRRQLLDIAILLTGLTLAVVIAALGLWMRELQQVRSFLLEQGSQLLIETIDFESEIGFGGFIHNFKNAILRPNELYYVVTAEANLRDAFVILDRLDVLTVSIGAPIDLSPIRTTLEQYVQSVQTLREQQDRGLTPAKLDELARVNDYDATESLTRLVEFARQELRHRTDRVHEKILRVSDWFAAAAALLTALLVFLFRKRQTDTAFIRKIAYSETAFLFDHICEGIVALSKTRRIMFLNVAARDMLGLVISTTPCHWPEEIRLHERKLGGEETSEPDLLDAVLAGQNLRQFPATLTNRESKKTITIRITCVRLADQFDNSVETALILKRDDSPETTFGTC